MPEPKSPVREARVPIELKVEYKRKNAFFADYTRNISKGGTFIQTAKPLPVGTEFLFKLVVADVEEPIAIRGQVRWTVEEGDAQGRDPGMGIGFLYANDAERKKVSDVVEKLMSESLGDVVASRLMSAQKTEGS